MTRKEALKIMKLFRSVPTSDKDSEVNQALDIAIKALEQESILNKIRAKIRALSNANPSYWHSGDMVERDDVLEILDKYKAESE